LIQEQRVTIAGSALDDFAIRAAVLEAGYDALCVTEHAPTAATLAQGRQARIVMND
jgi:hypothetical protein